MADDLDTKAEYDLAFKALSVFCARGGQVWWSRAEDPTKWEITPETARAIEAVRDELRAQRVAS